MQSASKSAPYVLMLHTNQGPPVTALSIYGRPTNIMCEYARFPDERAAQDEIRAISLAFKERREMRNRSYNMSDLERVWREYIVKAHAIK